MFSHCTTYLIRMMKKCHWYMHNTHIHETAKTIFIQQVWCQLLRIFRKANLNFHTQFEVSNFESAACINREKWLSFTFSPLFPFWCLAFEPSVFYVYIQFLCSRDNWIELLFLRIALRFRYVGLWWKVECNIRTNIRFFFLKFKILFPFRNQKPNQIHSKY